MIFLEEAWKQESCKTQLCLTAAVTAQQDILPSDKGKKSKVLFIDTENMFSSPRIYEIALARGFDPSSVFDNIHTLRVKNASDLQAYVENLLPVFLEKNHDIILLIVDSIISCHRAELRGLENLSQQQQSLNAVMHSLKIVADKFEIAVMVTTQLVEDPDSYFTDMTTQAAGDNIMAPASTHRLMLKLTGKDDKRIATMVYSPCYPVRNVLFRINHQGIIDEPTTQ
jgi:RecA/RadA recombinase